MSTRSFIGLLCAGGLVRGVYCHSDGYPEAPHGVGHKLATYFKDPVKVAELLDLGSLSALGDGLAKDAGTVAYGRDRQDEDTEACMYETVEAFKEAGRDLDAEYLYLFNGRTWEQV